MSDPYNKPLSIDPPTTGPKDTIWWRLVNLQPATWRGVVTAVVVLLAALGIKVAPGIPDAAFLVILALLPILQGLWTKSAVTPNAKVAVAVPDPINAPAEVTAGEAVVPDETPAEDILAAATEKGV
jgi:hypothetical protein